MDNARFLAVRSLERVLSDGAYSNIELKRTLARADLSPAGRALYKQLLFGTLSRLRYLDAALRFAYRGNFDKLSPAVKNALRVGAFQVCFSGQAQKGVNETVALIKKTAPGADKLANAVLRHLPDEKAAKEVFSPAERACVSDSLYALFAGIGAADFPERAFLPAPPVARVNTLKTDRASLAARLNAAEAPLENALYLSLSQSVESLPEYREGLFHLQGLSSQQCVAVLNPQAGETMLDLCAAPGGKTFTAAEMMRDKGQIFAFDLHEHRADLIRAGAARLGLTSITVAAADSTGALPCPQADCVLLDAPCSALGQLSRHPELRLREAGGFEELCATQKALLQNAARYLKNGGRLLYSTCTLNPAENGEQVKAFLAAHPDFTLRQEKTVTDPADGFYYALMEKK